MKRKVEVPKALRVAGIKVEQLENGWWLQCRTCKATWGYPMGVSVKPGASLLLLNHVREHQANAPKAKRRSAPGGRLPRSAR